MFQTTVLTYVEFNFSEKIKSEQVQSHLKLIFLTDLCPLEEEPHGLCIRRKLKLRIGEERTFFPLAHKSIVPQLMTEYLCYRLIILAPIILV